MLTDNSTKSGPIMTLLERLERVAQARTCVPTLATCRVFGVLSFTCTPAVHSTQVFEGTRVEVSSPLSHFS